MVCAMALYRDCRPLTTLAASGSAVRAGESDDEQLLSQSFALSDELSAASDDDDDAL